ncbi:DinB family protein [Flexivirga oryzae]|uniref:Putative damage-inducible protein DinB n=1 Tax=Flexivirga oryzae TaxID=1794944 RepID=A0A839N762_9MICO|nr:DinB family protein [Flexivirga oryzae]MBB2891055.1 putative damage-inducible protein DinB [Flexivirga oryzae]
MNMIVEAGTGVEKATLLAYLREQRAAVLAIVEGLDEAALRASVVPSGWTPIGLIWHLGGAEMYWFQIVLADRVPDDDEHEDEPDEEAPAEGFRTDDPIEEVLEAYRAQCRASDEVLASASLDAAPRGPVAPGHEELGTSVRTIVLHMIEETARHAGHLDIARELLDGRTGLGPR